MHIAVDVLRAKVDSRIGGTSRELAEEAIRPADADVIGSAVEAAQVPRVAQVLAGPDRVRARPQLDVGTIRLRSIDVEGRAGLCRLHRELELLAIGTQRSVCVQVVGQRARWPGTRLLFRGPLVAPA